ncbi:hypothetical protein [Cylindrospermum sp. FACHB-282]|nr:hypothetical protein [Cylindrospermum sp. FACHB-282]
MVVPQREKHITFRSTELAKQLLKQSGVPEERTQTDVLPELIRE